MEKICLWVSQPHFGSLEIAKLMGISSIVVELEHGTFDLATLDHFLAMTRALGVRTLAKVIAPTTEAIQQALDFGADSVVIPHLLGVEHVHEVTRAAKYPPHGIRSYTGGRVYGYGRPAADAFDNENLRTRCYAMIETAESLADVEKIAALPNVDGIFPGPSDLSLSRGRGAYAFSEVDRADLTRCARAAQASGKPWVMPAWTPEERAFGAREDAELLVVASQFMTIRAGLNATLGALRQEKVLD